MTRERGVKGSGISFTGQLGDGASIDSLVPGQVHQLDAGVVGVSAGGCHTCAIAATGSVTCRGGCTKGKPGDVPTVDRHTPVTEVEYPYGPLLTAHVAVLASTAFVRDQHGLRGGSRRWFSQLDCAWFLVLEPAP